MFYKMCITKFFVMKISFCYVFVMAKSLYLWAFSAIYNIISIFFLFSKKIKYIGIFI